MTDNETQVYDPNLKLGMIAGGGSLPAQIYQAVLAQGGDIHILGIKGAVSPELPYVACFNIEHIGKFFKAFKKAGCQQVVIIGDAQRPNLLTLRPDFEGMKVLARILFKPKRGDDVLLREIVRAFTLAAFEILPPHAVAQDLTPPAGNLTQKKPTKTDLQDITLGIEVTRSIGRLDIGQASVVCRGQVLAVEGVDGTDALITRVACLAENLRGSKKKPQGVLVKLPKPQQDPRIDLPAFGLNTVENAAKACLSGLVFEAHGAVFNDLNACIQRADELDLFIHGIMPEGGAKDIS